MDTPLRLHDRRRADADGAPAMTPAFLAVLEGPRTVGGRDIPAAALAAARARLAREHPALSVIVDHAEALPPGRLARVLGISVQRCVARHRQGLALLKGYLEAHQIGDGGGAGGKVH